MTGIALLLLVAIATALLWLGRRGRRVDDHPVCRGCEYDLYGHTSSMACPECGRSLAGRRAVRIGNRRRRPGLIWAGRALLALAAVPLLGAALGAMTGVQAIARYEPFWLLERQAMVFASDGATAELQRRAAAGALTPGQVAVLIDAVAEHQKDRARPWPPRLGDLWWAMASAGLVPQADLQQYTDRMFADTALKMRSRLRAGDPMVLKLRGEVRGLGSPTAADQVRLVWRSVSVSGHWGTFYNADEHYPLILEDQLLATRSVPAARRQHVPLGEHEVVAVVDLSLLGAPPPPVVTQMKLTTRYEQVAPFEPLVAVERDDAVFARVARDARIVAMRQPTDGDLRLTLRFPPRRIALAYDIYVINGPNGGEHLLTAIDLPSADNERGWSTGGSVPAGWRPERVDLELRPSTRQALSDPDIDTILDGSLHFDDVPVTQGARSDLRSPTLDIRAREAQPE